MGAGATACTDDAGSDDLPTPRFGFRRRGGARFRAAEKSMSFWLSFGAGSVEVAPKSDIGIDGVDAGIRPSRSRSTPSSVDALQTGDGEHQSAEPKRRPDDREAPAGCHRHSGE
jgi:hypothetical protein